MSDPRPPVSGYVRTLNEARRIGPVVAAARAAFAEVVVVDSGSTDGTRALAEAAGARVVEQRWLGNGAQKRVAEDACRHDWLFDLDADEIVTPALAREVAALFAGGGPDRDAYWTPLEHLSPLDPDRVVGRAKRLKLYDRRRARAPDHPLWSNVEPEPGARVGALKAAVRHHLFADAADLAEKMNRRSTRNAALGAPKSLNGLRLRILFGLPVYVLKNLLTRGMLRGGVHGFAVAVLVGFGRWLRDVKMYEAARGLGRGEGRVGEPRT